MKQVYEKLKKYLENENKENAVKYIIQKVNNGDIGVLSLYENVLEPILNNITCSLDEKVCIWKEHVRSSIVRTIIESCYINVLKLRDEKGYKNNKSVVVMCPDGESHEIGARIISDYFTVYGFNSLFVGANTPKNEFLDVINLTKPDLIAISVTNFYNIIAAKKTINTIREKAKYKVKIVVGGNAFRSKPQLYKEIGADILLTDKYEVIKDLAEWSDQ